MEKQDFLIQFWRSTDIRIHSPQQTTDLSTDRRDIHNQIYVSKQPININNNNDNQQLVIIRPSVGQSLEREAHPNRNDIISLPDPV